MRISDWSSDVCSSDLLKTTPATVFLVLPPDRLASYARWLRLMVAQALTELARAPGRPPWPVLFLLDEFAALGRPEPVQRAMGLTAGSAVQLWPNLQDVHQIRALHRQRAGPLPSHAGAPQVFVGNDPARAHPLSNT